MTDMEHGKVKPWVDLYREHRDLREKYGKDLVKSISGVLADVVRKHPSVIDPGIPSRFTYRKTKGNLVHYAIWGRVGDESGHEIASPDLRNARLSVEALEDRRKRRLIMFTVMVDGTTHDGRPWCVAVHLPEDLGPNRDRQGSGACGHPVLHCHAGPTLDHKPKLRVPLPALPPADILRWVLSQVIPGYEPAPWDDLAGHLPE